MCIFHTKPQLKMLQGYLPPVELLQRYGLSHYLVFREAIQNGDVGLFQRSMVVSKECMCWFERVCLCVRLVLG